MTHIGGDFGQVFFGSTEYRNSPNKIEDFKDLDLP